MQGALYDGLNSGRRAARAIDESNSLGYGLISDRQAASAADK